ncbi:MAG TPA: hypothetical protein PK513_05835 [Alphaproteobacteria bacterium]|nr:hypothetical protein [Alphaproteobacteria bacterium]USO06079.1 MAG: hypothetical protein H6859_02450 [Rhodospirillales bacterium]HOO82002.1 hypothetical protein [Alphaproteobacteria bacterium]
MTTTPRALTIFFSTQTSSDEIAKVCTALTSRNYENGVRLSTPMQNSKRPKQNQATAITFKIEAKKHWLSLAEEKDISNNIPKVAIAHQFHSKPECDAA